MYNMYTRYIKYDGKIVFSYIIIIRVENYLHSEAANINIIGQVLTERVWRCVVCICVSSCYLSRSIVSL